MAFEQIIQAGDLEQVKHFFVNLARKHESPSVLLRQLNAFHQRRQTGTVHIIHAVQINDDILEILVKRFIDGVSQHGRTTRIDWALSVDNDDAPVFRHRKSKRRGYDGIIGQFVSLLKIQ